MSGKHDRRSNGNDREVIGEQIDAWGTRLPWMFQRVRLETIDGASVARLTEFVPWLQSALLSECDKYFFFNAIDRLGFARAVLAEIDHRDSTEKDRRRGEGRVCLPNEDIVPDVLRHVLESEGPAEPGCNVNWRQIAIKWLPRYLNEDRGELIALLTRAFRWPAAADSFHAAVHLAELAPYTPGCPSACSRQRATAIGSFPIALMTPAARRGRTARSPSWADWKPIASARNCSPRWRPGGVKAVSAGDAGDGVDGGSPSQLSPT